MARDVRRTYLVSGTGFECGGKLEVPLLLRSPFSSFAIVRGTRANTDCPVISE